MVTRWRCDATAASRAGAGTSTARRPPKASKVTSSRSAQALLTRWRYDATAALRAGAVTSSARRLPMVGQVPSDASTYKQILLQTNFWYLLTIHASSATTPGDSGGSPVHAHAGRLRHAKTRCKTSRGRRSNARTDSVTEGRSDVVRRDLP